MAAGHHGAEWLRIPYLEIAKAAALPAIIDQLALLGAVHLLSLKYGIRGIPRADLPRFWKTVLSGLHHMVPVGVLLYYLIAKNYTPLTSCFYAIIGAVGMFLAASAVQGARRRPIVPGLEPASGVGEALAASSLRLVQAMYMGARNMASVAVTCACAGIIVGIVSLTGVGLNLASIVVDLSAGSLYLGLFLTMIACLILGMGVPTTPTYIIMATLTAPAMLLIDTTVLEATWIFITASVGMYGLAAAMQGYLVTEARWYERIVLFVGAVLLVYPGLYTDIAGIILFAVAYMSQRRRAPNAPLI